jgi:hypothetical protein
LATIRPQHKAIIVTSVLLSGCAETPVWVMCILLYKNNKTQPANADWVFTKN